MHDDLKLETRDKVLQKMSRNGAVEQNISRGTDQNVSSRTAEIAFEKSASFGSDMEFGRRAKDAAGSAGQAGSMETAGQAGRAGMFGCRNAGAGGYRGADSGGHRGTGSYGQGNAPYSDHEAYLDSLLQKAWADAGHETGAYADSGSTRLSQTYRDGTEAGRMPQARRMQDYLMTGDGFDLTGHRALYAAGDRTAAESDAAEHAGGEAETYLSDGRSGLLQENRTGAFSFGENRGTGGSLADKAAYKKRIRQESVRRNALYEKPAGQGLGSGEKASGKAEELFGGSGASWHTGKGKAMAAVREGHKAGTVLKPFSGAADKLTETVSSSAHEKIRESEDENASVQAAHEAELQAEHVIQSAGRKAADAGKAAAYKRRGRLKLDDEEPVADAASGRNASKAQGFGQSGLRRQNAVQADSAPGEPAPGGFGQRDSWQQGSGQQGPARQANGQKGSTVGKEQKPGSGSAGRKTGRSRLSFSSGRAENAYQLSMEAEGSGGEALTPGKQSGGKLRFGNKPEADDAKKPDLKKKIQKKRIKREYAAALRDGKNGVSAGTKASSKAAEAVKEGAGKARDILAGIIRKNYGVLIALGVMGIICIMILSASGTAASMLSEAGDAFVGSTYLSSDDDITDNDAAYEEMEAELQDQIDSIEEDYPGYDEYRYQVDEISHDPYALASYFTAVYGNYKAADVASELLPLFQEQYTLTLNEVVETKTRTVTDPDTGEETEEEYDWYVLEVTLANADVDTAAQAHMNESQRMLYKTYMASKGNRSYLFGDGAVPGNVAGGGLSYDIPPEALEDEAFARMINEAEKYLGMEYVWGGSSPSTGFDCSGFVSWVINHSGNGWDVGRSTANGLMGHCAHVSAADAKPGDLIFFEKTYNTSGASHVGIYVGDGMMIHCGNPIQYTSINSSYWQSHFLGFGRISD